VEHLFYELDGSRRALILERLDVGLAVADPDVLRRFALQVWRLKVPVIATAVTPELPAPLDRVFLDARWLPNNRVRRAAAWRHHLGERVTDDVIEQLAARPAAMRQIARAASIVAVRGDDSTLLFDALSQVQDTGDE
jgi:hypothetical protein